VKKLEIHIPKGVLIGNKARRHRGKEGYRGTKAKSFYARKNNGKIGIGFFAL
jgi:hypothetical protein